MSFKTELEELRKTYQDTERQFIDLSTIMPYVDNPWNFYSPRLYNILQFSCAQVESLIKRIVGKLNLTKPNSKYFPAYYEVLNIDDLLSMQTILLVNAKKAITPFKKNKENESPFWWTAYNETKHDLPKGLRQGTIDNVIHSLGGLYILHGFADLLEPLSGSNKFLNSKLWKTWEEKDLLEHDNLFGMPNVGWKLKSELFRSLTSYVGDDEGFK